MRVYLVRHGEALSKSVDPEAGLSKKGREDVKKVARLIGGLGIEVEAVWESGKKRAAQTAEIMAGAITSRDGVVSRTGISPMAAAVPIAGELAASEGDIMIVSHLPFLPGLASYLVLGMEGPEVVVFPTGAMACLEKDSGRRWVVRWVVIPELL